MGFYNFVTYFVLAMVFILIKKSLVAAVTGELNAPCTHVEECRKFAYYCSKNWTCQCIPPYIVYETKQICVGGVGQKCQYDDHCINGAYCKKQETCQCKETSPYVLEGGLICSSFAPSASSMNHLFLLRHAADVKGKYILIALSLIGFYIL